VAQGIGVLIRSPLFIQGKVPWSLGGTVKRKYIIFGVIAACLPLSWFVAVDWSWFVETCPDCGYGKDTLQYRVFTIPVQQTVHEHVTVVHRVSRDLGVECMHPSNERWHKHRWWGLCFCKAPCINGIHRIIDNHSWYSAEIGSKLQALARDDPSVQRQFTQQVLKDHDFGYINTVFDRAGVEL
jgi:hypothetical protein